MQANFETGLKCCASCKRDLPLTEFGKDKIQKDGLNTYCISCRRKISYKAGRKYYELNKDKVKAYQKKYRETHREQIHATNKKRNDTYTDKRKDCQIRSLYGVSLEEVRSKLHDMNWKCPGCRKQLTEETFVIDHDHTNGEKGYRLILCRQCNSCIGFAKDSPQTLRRLAHLLEKNNRDGDSVRRTGVI